MKDREKIKKGCLGCAGIGCATYIVLSAISLLFYLLVMDTPLDAVKKCSYRKIIQTEMTDDTGRIVSGFEEMLEKSRKMGINVNWKLCKAIAAKKPISDVKYAEKVISPGLKYVIVSAKIKGAGHGDKKVDVDMAFMVKPKSLLSFDMTVLLGLSDIVAKYNGYSRRLAIDFPTRGNEAANVSENGLLFLAALYTDDDAPIAEFADLFLAAAEANRANASSGTPGVQMDR